MFSRSMFVAILAPCLALPATIATAASDKVAELHQLFDDAWQADLAHDPLFASSLGDRRFNDRWPDISLTSISREHLHNGEVLVRLEAIDPAALPPAERLNHELFRREYTNRIESYGFRQFLIPLNQRGGIQTADEVTQVLNFSTLGDYADWISRIRAFGVYMDQTIALMEQGLAEGIMPPRVIMERIPGQIDAQIVADSRESPFYAPFRNFPDGIPAEDRERLEVIAAKAIDEFVIPAYQRFRTFFTERYLPACRDTVGIWAVPDGRAYYEFRARSYTTTALTPDEIHEIGLAEVARIHDEMLDIIEQVGFEGTFQEFLEFLRTDPQFYFDDPQELFAAYAATSKRIDPEMVKLFGKLPRTPYGVRAIPEASAPDTTTAYYMPPAGDGSRAGFYYVNLYRPEVRPKYEIEVLTVHEAVPGHHLQIALAQELEDLPEFRRFLGFTAFVEGWGLYSESLGEEIGLYADPYSKFGQLTYDMWRAVRLVVDTGIHYRGWTRQQAIDFFAANAAKTEHDIVNEIDRYIAWPGQALAYKIGQLKIRELRGTSTARLGRHFDLKAFHDVVLGSGAVPLDVLQANVEAWIESRLGAAENATDSPAASQ